MLPHLLPEEPSRGTSPPDSPSSTPAFSLACLLAALSVGALNSGYAQHRPGEGLAQSFLLPQLPALHSARGEGREEQGLFFLHKRKKEKKKAVFPSLVV